MSFLFVSKSPPIPDKVSDIKVLAVIDEKEPKRFSEYFDAYEQYMTGVKSTSGVMGAAEPAHLKKMRPFLLPMEVESSHVVSSKLFNSFKPLPKPMLKSNVKALAKNAKHSKNNKKGKSSNTGGTGKTLKRDKALTWNIIGRMPAPNNYVSANLPYNITQEVEATARLTTSTTLSVFVSINFIIGNLDQISSLSAVFDQYRIFEIEHWLIPRVFENLAKTDNQSLLNSVVDYDDSNNFTSFAQATDYTNVLTTSGAQGHYRKFTPHVAVASYSGTFTSFTNVVAPWIDMASPSVQHYGIKLAHLPTDSVYVYDEVTRYHVQFRNIK